MLMVLEVGVDLNTRLQNDVRQLCLSYSRQNTANKKMIVAAEFKQGPVADEAKVERLTDASLAGTGLGIIESVMKRGGQPKVDDGASMSYSRSMN